MHPNAKTIIYFTCSNTSSWRWHSIYHRPEHHRNRGRCAGRCCPGGAQWPEQKRCHLTSKPALAWRNCILHNIFNIYKWVLCSMYFRKLYDMICLAAKQQTMIWVCGCHNTKLHTGSSCLYTYETACWGQITHIRLTMKYIASFPVKE